MRQICPQLVHLKRGNSEAKDGQESGLSQTPIFVVLPVWELEEEDRENNEWRKGGISISQISEHVQNEGR